MAFKKGRKEDGKEKRILSRLDHGDKIECSYGW